MNRVSNKGGARPEKLRTKTVEMSVSLRFTARRYAEFQQTAARLGLTSDQLASAVAEVGMAGDDRNPFPEIASFLTQAAVDLYPECRRLTPLRDAWTLTYDTHDVLAEARLS